MKYDTNNLLELPRVSIHLDSQLYSQLGPKLYRQVSRQLYWPLREQLLRYMRNSIRDRL